MNVSNLKSFFVIHKQNFWLVSPIVAIGALLLSLPFLPVTVRLTFCFVLSGTAIFLSLTQGPIIKPLTIPVIELGIVALLFGVLMLANLESLCLAISILLCFGLLLLFLLPKIKSGVKSTQPTD